MTPRAEPRRASSTRRCRALVLTLLCGVVSGLPSRVHAQTCAPPTLVDAAWPAPLDQRITVRGGELTLRDALDRVAATSGVRLSWSDASLVLDTRVCLEASRAPLGALLSALTAPFDVAPRVAGASLVVLAPTPRVARRPVPTIRAASLERVVVTGTVNGAAQRGLTTALGVVSADALDGRGSGDVAQFLNGAVPGVWVWSQAPMALTARYGSVRGASSFSVSLPKVYVDGIEVANPLVVAHLPSESIDRLEVLRGPQGAALYGTDAISGVVQIVTRAPTRVGSAPGVSVRARAGALNSAYGAASTLSDEYVVSGQRGSTARAVFGTASFSRAGAYVPDGDSRQLTASVRARALGTRHVLEGTLRAVVADAATSSNPLLLAAMQSGLTLPDSLRRVLPPARAERWLDSLARRLALDRSPRQSVRQVTTGVTGTLHADQRWTHRATIGLDAYALDGTTAGPSPLPSSADSALRAAEGSAMRVSGRASSAATWRGDEWRRTLTLSTEHALLREATSNLVLARPRPMVEAATNALTTVWRQTNGAVAQLDADWRERWYVTAGTRVERSAGFTERALVSVLPMLGTAVVFDAEPVSTKLRAAYGKGIRPPRATIGAGTISNATLLANASLEAEEQAGTEVGIDVHAGTRAALHITRFDQRATGLVQPVTVLQSSPQPGGPPRPGDPLQRNLAYQLQNVGAISNRGWELAASVRGGPMALQATFATVDSRVDAVRRSYTGELRVGDRVLDVPARTYGLTAQLAHAGWAFQARTTRVEDWIGYDRLAAAEAYASSRRPSGEFVGGALRQFWMRYPGVTRLGATVTRELRGDLSLQLVGENLLDVQTGEPDNATILPGRLVSLGVRARF